MNYNPEEIFDSESFALRLAQLREGRLVSARTMSHELGHNHSYISQIESQKFLPSLSEFFEICNYLSVTPREFFDNGVKSPYVLNSIALLCQNLKPEQIDCVYNLLLEFAAK